MPINPRRVDFPSTSDRKLLRISRIKGSERSGSSKHLRQFKSSVVRTGFEMTGPLPFVFESKEESFQKKKVA